MLTTLKNRLSRFYASSLHRQLLEEKIVQSSGDVIGNVLDAGSKNRRYDDYFQKAKKIIAVDLAPSAGHGVIPADITKLPFRAESFEAVVSFEVLEYVLNTALVLTEFARVLKMDGVLIFSAPFLNPVHGDVDRIRYTPKAWKELLSKEFDIEKEIAFGGRYTIIWDFFFEKVRNHYGKLAKGFWLPFLFITKKIALYLDQQENNSRYPMGYFFVCRRKG